MITADPRSILSVGATLGEGPVWVARDAALWFVDIKAHRVHRYDPALDVGRSWLSDGESKLVGSCVKLTDVALDRLQGLSWARLGWRSEEHRRPDLGGHGSPGAKRSKCS